MARFHGDVWSHPTEQFFPALRIHGCQFAHQFVARFPFRILAQTDADREKRRDDPNRNVCRSQRNSLFLFRNRVQPQAQKAAEFDVPGTDRRFSRARPPRNCRHSLYVCCAACVVLANAPLARAQEATLANLPDQFETRESMPTPKSKKKKAEPSLKIAARASTRKPAPATGQTTHPPEEPVTPAMPVQKKTRAKKRTAPAVQSEAASSSTPTPLSLPAAQAMAVSAPLPEYPYQAKRANITGSGVCVITIDTASGKVTDAMMAQSTGDAMLDKVTTNTFRRWRFKPGTMSQVRVPVDYE